MLDLGTLRSLKSDRNFGCDIEKLRTDILRPFQRLVASEDRFASCSSGISDFQEARSRLSNSAPVAASDAWSPSLTSASSASKSFDLKRAGHLQGRFGYAEPMHVECARCKYNRCLKKFEDIDMAMQVPAQAFNLFYRFFLELG